MDKALEVLTHVSYSVNFELTNITRIFNDIIKPLSDHDVRILK